MASQTPVIGVSFKNIGTWNSKALSKTLASFKPVTLDTNYDIESNVVSYDNPKNSTVEVSHRNIPVEEQWGRESESQNVTDANTAHTVNNDVPDNITKTNKELSMNGSSQSSNDIHREQKDANKVQTLNNNSQHLEDSSDKAAHMEPLVTVTTQNTNNNAQKSKENQLNSNNDQTNDNTHCLEREAEHNQTTTVRPKDTVILDSSDSITEQNSQNRDGHTVNNQEFIHNNIEHLESPGNSYTHNIADTNTPTSKHPQYLLEVVDLNYTAKIWNGRWWNGACCRPRKVVKILRGINMKFKSGQLTAIMGNSGSGKTSLLDVIASRIDGETEGQVLFNGSPLTGDIFKTVGGYVIQADRQMPNLTVEETLTYVANLKFSGSLPQHSITEKVNTVIDDLGLRGIKDSRIGGVIIRGISGGELRRVSVAAQMLQDPAILLLDEPTTGLDSFTAHSLVKSLCAMAKQKNKLIIMSIHQPRSELFALLDSIGILTQGEVVYFGPKEDSIKHFTDLGHPCPTYANPLDIFIDIASIDRRDNASEQETFARVSLLKEEYRKSKIYNDMIEDKPVYTEYSSHLDDVHNTSSCVQFSSKLWTLFRRINLNLYRDRSDLVVRSVTMVVYACFLWIFVWRLGFDFVSVQDRAGVFYQSVSVPPMVGLLNCIALFPVQRNLYYREAGDGLYGASAFLLTYYIHIIPFHLISSMGYSAWVYWAIGMNPDVGRFFIYYAMVVLLQYAGELQTVLCLAVLDKPPLAQGISTLIMSASVLGATGFVRTISEMFVPLQWLSYLSYMKYGAEIVAANEYHELQFDCPEDSVIPCDLLKGDLYLDRFYPNSVQNMGRNFGLIVAIIAGMAIFNIIVFKVKGVKHLH